MSTWIITTGNSDVQLKTDDNWNTLYDEVNEQPPLSDCNEFFSINRDEFTKLYPVPARVLGLVYKDKIEIARYFQDLSFPLLDNFFDSFDCNKLEYPKTIIVLITDQTKIFKVSEQDINGDSPYWQDTCELESILEKYINLKFQDKNRHYEQLIFRRLEPNINQMNQNQKSYGLDNWNETLNLVNNAFQELLKEINLNQNEIVYVSHQAGTPAISSAVQFASLGKFQQVKFLVSNPYINEDYKPLFESQIIPSSNYWRGIQIQKAKQLILNGLPGAALEILKDIGDIDAKAKMDLTRMVGVFNIANNLPKRKGKEPGKEPGKEFEPKEAVKRIIDALELIEIFFDNKNYLQGISLLSAAQEVFLKAAIINELQNKYSTIPLSVNNQDIILNINDVICWDQTGLGFVQSHHDAHLKNIMGVPPNYNIKKEKLEILDELKFPVDDTNKLKEGTYGKFHLIGKNTGMLAWLSELRPDFKIWGLLEWIGQYKREYEDDRRNQLMHNLLGVKTEEVTKYLLGTETNNIYRENVLSAYKEKVKQPFITGIQKLEISDYTSNLREKLKNIADSLN